MTVVYRPLSEIATIFAGLMTHASDGREAGEGGNLLTVRNLTGTDLDLLSLSQVDWEGRDVERYRVRPGDLLISARSTSLKVAIVPPGLEHCLINATLLGVRSLPALHPRILAAWFSSPGGAAGLEGVSQSGTHQMNITASGLSRIVVPIPPVEWQRRMVDLLESSDEAYRAATEAAEGRRLIARDAVISQLLTHGTN